VRSLRLNSYVWEKVMGIFFGQSGSGLHVSQRNIDMATGPDKVTSPERPDHKNTEIHPPKRTRGLLTAECDSDGAEHSYKQVVPQIQGTTMDWSRMGGTRSNPVCKNFDG
jgi:hypothetical protein